MDTITVAVDADVAQAYRTVSARDRRKLDLLVNLRLREATSSGQSLREVMDEISRSAHPYHPYSSTHSTHIIVGGVGEGVRPASWRVRSLTNRGPQIPFGRLQHHASALRIAHTEPCLP